MCPFRHAKATRQENNSEENVSQENYSQENVSQENDTLENDFMESNATGNDRNFMTSTPTKKKYDCNDCRNKSQCVDCFVQQENPDDEESC